MSAIAGALSFDGRAAAFAEHLLDSQAAYGRHRRDLALRGDYAAGRCLHRMLAEDEEDRQPLSGGDGRFTLVADLRLDNRDELGAKLGLGRLDGLSDCALLLHAWMAWGPRLLDHILGDFAFALWDERDSTLLLARDTAGERPLHYRSGDGFIAFASMPGPLASLPGLPCEIDESRVARFVADLPPGGPGSFFAGVNRLEPGHRAIATRRGVEVTRYWRPPARTLHLPRRGDYGEALREQLDCAVRRRLRRSEGLVGAHLSSGLDSSAVTTSAALALAGRGERLLAFTSAPRRGFAGPVVAGRIGDESSLAAATAAIHANVDHHILRPEGGSALGLLERSHLLAGQPVGHVCNNLWWQGINRDAAEAGVKVMLTGEAGNFTISAGLGIDTLADLARSGSAGRWWREARALRRRGAFSWPQLLNGSLGPLVPERVYARLRGVGPLPAPFLAPPWRRALREPLAAAGRAIRPPSDSAERRWAMLQTADPGPFRKLGLASWGIEERDPTNDRRLVEFCFSLPAEALLEDGVRRPALRRALAGRIPQAVLDQRLRGYQMPDWYERIKRDEVVAFARAAAAPQAASSAIDLAEVEAAAASWPTSGWERRPVVYLYRMQLLRTLAAAAFVNSVRSGALG